MHGTTTRVRAPIVYAASLILAACSLLYELLIAQTLSLLAANTVIWYSLTVGTYLGAMGLGALIYDARSKPATWDRLYRIEMLLSVAGAGAVVLIYLAHTVGLYYRVSDMQLAGAVAFFGPSFLMIVVVGILTGIELPLLIRLGNDAAGGKDVTNRVLGFDYLGALIAGLVFPLVLVPRLSLITIGFVIAGVNLLMAILALLLGRASTRRLAVKIATTATLTVVLFTSVFNPAALEQYFMKKYYYYLEYSDSLSTLLGPINGGRSVFRARSPYQQIDLVFDSTGYKTDFLIDAYSTKFVENPLQPRNYFLFLNGDLQVNSNYEELYHEYFAHVGVIANGAVPERVLVLGAGDGLLIRELIKYDEVRKIVHVDLDPKLLELADDHPVLRVMNGGALQDSRVKTQVGDAFQYLRNTTDRFDAIYMDFPYAKDYNLSKLYSREFYHFVRERLADDGYAVLDAPTIGKAWEIYYQTIRKAGFETLQSYQINIEYDNARAYELLAEEWGELPEEEQREIVEDHVNSLRIGFILMRRDGEVRQRYVDFGIKLHVLNEQRFQLAFSRPRPTTDSIDETKVNSILRPTLPIVPAWKARRAWE